MPWFGIRFGAALARSIVAFYSGAIGRRILFGLWLRSLLTAIGILCWPSAS